MLGIVGSLIQTKPDLEQGCMAEGLWIVWDRQCVYYHFLFSNLLVNLVDFLSELISFKLTCCSPPPKKAAEMFRVHLKPVLLSEDKEENTLPYVTHDMLWEIFWGYTDALLPMRQNWIDAPRSAAKRRKENLRSRHFLSRSMISSTSSTLAKRFLCDSLILSGSWPFSSRNKLISNIL